MQYKFLQFVQHSFSLLILFSQRLVPLGTQHSKWQFIAPGVSAQLLGISHAVPVPPDDELLEELELEELEELEEEELEEDELLLDEELDELEELDVIPEHPNFTASIPSHPSI